MQRVNVLMNRYVSRFVSCGYYEAELVREDKPDRRRPDVDAPAFSSDAGNVSPPDGYVSNLFGRALSQGIYYIVIMLLMTFWWREEGD